MRVPKLGGANLKKCSTFELSFAFNKLCVSLATFIFNSSSALRFSVCSAIILANFWISVIAALYMTSFAFGILNIWSTRLHYCPLHYCRSLRICFSRNNDFNNRFKNCYWWDSGPALKCKFVVCFMWLFIDIINATLYPNEVWRLWVSFSKQLRSILPAMT